MTDKLCKTCKHWAHASDDWGNCERAKSSGGRQDDATTLAYASDCETYGAWLTTAAAFGCVQWEKRDD